jgi:threonine synthase
LSSTAKYISTRGEAPALSFTDTLMAGLASDGGLYLPETYPQLSKDEISAFASATYAQVAEAVFTRFIGADVEAKTRASMIEAAYAGFRHKAIAPLAQIDDHLFVLELFHGPTLAFKDVAMQLLARLTDHVLQARHQHATVVGATSGDTGAAAIEAFRGLDHVDVFILYPHERVSDVQRRQMTTVEGDNVHVIALEGTFDDAQAILKGLFQKRAFRDELSLTGVNSINWARVMAQIVYYMTSAVALGAPHRPVSFAVPTGNFGDILAGYIAKRMGLPVEQLIIATNTNDILARTLATGSYELKSVEATQSPSMDIQISSNFERLLFEAYGRDADAIRRLMANLQQSGRFTIDEVPLRAIRAEFTAQSVSETETTGEIARVFKETGTLIDPHTAIGVRAGRDALAKNAHTPVIALGTAHPAKFPDAIEKATGQRPGLPAHLSDLFKKEERFTVLPNDQAAIETFIRAHTRIPSLRTRAAS